MNTQKFKEIIISIKELRKLGLEFDDNLLLDSATKIYNTEIINESKNTLFKYTPREERRLVSPPATDKQIHYLCKNNIDHNAETLTKKQAFELIKAHKER